VAISANTRVVRVSGELFVSLHTIEELAVKMVFDNPATWTVEIETLKTLARNAREAARRLNI
jgi:hypothetical protein